MQKKVQKRKAVKVVSEACPHSSKADVRERNKNRSVKLQKLYMDNNKKKEQQLNERHSLFPRSNLVVYSNFSGNLQGNYGMAFGRGFKINQSFICFLNDDVNNI